ncbi:MAG: hypothetical protein WBQ59_13260, partial [Candidatus Acidiferrum sp.]
MHKLPEVQEAKELMNQARDWSAFRWLFEKPRVRQAADRANAALDRLNRSVKSRWSNEVKSTYKTLNKAGAARRQETTHQQPESDASEI